MMLFIKGFRFLRKIIFIPINVSLIVIAFYLRKSFLGFQNATLYLSKVDKNAVIPLLKFNGVSIGENCDIEAGLIFHNCTSFGNLSIGNNCHIGKGCFFDLRDKITIEDNCVISMRSTFITHIDMNKSDLKHYYPAHQKHIIIKKNTYIGASSTVLMGVEIEENSIVAANALVTKNVKSYTMVGGIPAALIKTIKKTKL